MGRAGWGGGARGVWLCFARAVSLVHPAFFCGHPSHRPPRGLLSLSGRDGGNRACTCKTLAESAGWSLLRQQLCPPLARVMAENKAKQVEVVASAKL